MTIALRPPIDAERFLEWAVRQVDQRHELKDGRVRAMISATRGHAAVSYRIARELERALGSEAWSISVADLAVRIGEDVRCPDVLVERAGGDPRGRASTEPVVVVEVLSPSSLATDFRVMPDEYMALPSLLAYVVASAEAPHLWVWNRGGAGFPREPDEVEGREAVAALPGLGIALALEAIYRGIGEG